MAWPNIFWPKKLKPGSEPTPIAQPNSGPEKPASGEVQPPSIKPVPATATVGAQPVPTPVVVPPPFKAESKPELKTEPPAEPKPAPASPTLPATHGVVLRPPSGRTTPTNISSPTFQPPRAITPPRPQEPLKNIEQLMAEADPVQTLRQTGNLRVLKPLNAPDTAPLPKVTPNTAPATAKVDPQSPSARLAPLPPEAPSGLLPAPPSFRPTVTAPPPSIRRIPVPVPAPTPIPTPAPLPPPTSVVENPVAAPEDDSPFILKPAPVASNPVPAWNPPSATTPPLAPASPETPSSGAATAKILPPNAPGTMSPVSSILRRKARMADVARIVLPPKREDTQQLHPIPKEPVGPSPTVVPPAFPVVAMTARATQHLAKVTTPTPVPAPDAPEKIVPENKLEESTPKPTGDTEDSFILKPEKIDAPKTDSIPPEPAKTEPAQDKAVESTPVEKPAEPKPDARIEPTTPPAPAPSTEIKPVEPLIATPDVPKVDPEAHKPEPSPTPEPKIDPEAHKPTPPPAAKEPEAKPDPAPVTTLSTAPTPEKREFHLANGERVAGTVLSETPESVYIEHATLGVLTIPRSNIAKRLVEIILINGDRIVGDIMAETPDTLYVRHASLGMLTVPRAQRSTRVVEAILKDGDRILGEVLTETDTFTVIRSASLGTITVPHTKLAMLNRKLEQIEMKSLPALPELKDTPKP